MGEWEWWMPLAAQSMMVGSILLPTGRLLKRIMLQSKLMLVIWMKLADKLVKINHLAETLSFDNENQLTFICVTSLGRLLVQFRPKILNFLIRIYFGSSGPSKINWDVATRTCNIFLFMEGE